MIVSSDKLHVTTIENFSTSSLAWNTWYSIIPMTKTKAAIGNTSLFPPNLYPVQHLVIYQTNDKKAALISMH